MAMETILGIKGPDFVMLASDTMQAKSLIFMKDDQSKIHRLSDFNMMATVGDGGDTIQFTDYISKNLHLYKITNGYHLSAKAAAHFTRKNLADYLRTNTRYQVAMLVAGFDAAEGPDLHYIDSYGAAQPINHAGHGWGSMFCGSILQRFWHPRLTQPEAYSLMGKCVLEIQRRLIINQRNFEVYVVDAKGMRKMEPINPGSLSKEAISLCW
ncbi:probable proteasome subunit beta type-2 [Drosophila ficusphila]|uniref:probable proteasome subunit beta type-2 n=1 Tax=Drosophila ficusphila TaxID=30025 RepID=UPI0007E887D4|nr:probable proteasome subunit beta type-2 [Drosophila ficusphila]